MSGLISLTTLASCGSEEGGADTGSGNSTATGDSSSTSSGSTSTASTSASGTMGGGGSGGTSPVVPGEVFDPKGLLALDPDCDFDQYQCNGICYDTGAVSPDCDLVATGVRTDAWFFGTDGALYVYTDEDIPIRRIDPATLDNTGLAGSDQILLTEPGAAPLSLVPDDGYIYFPNRKPTNTPDDETDSDWEYLIQRMPIAGGDVETLVMGLEDAVEDLAVAAGRLVFNVGSYNPLHVANIDGTDHQESQLVEITSAVGVGDDFWLYRQDRLDVTRMIMKAPGGDISAAIELYPPPEYIPQLYTHASVVYWASERAMGHFTDEALVETMVLPTFEEGSRLEVGFGPNHFFWLIWSRIYAQKHSNGETRVVGLLEFPAGAISNGEYVFVRDSQGRLFRFRL